MHACTHSYDQVQKVCYVHSYRHIRENQEHSRFYAMKQPKSVNVEVISVMLLTAYTDPRRSREITVTKPRRNNGYVCKVEGFRLHRQSNLVTFPCMTICVHAFSCLSCWSSPSSLLLSSLSCASAYLTETKCMSTGENPRDKPETKREECAFSLIPFSAQFQQP